MHHQNTVPAGPIKRLLKKIDPANLSDEDKKLLHEFFLAHEKKEIEKKSRWEKFTESLQEEEKAKKAKRKVFEANTSYFFTNDGTEYTITFTQKLVRRKRKRADSEEKPHKKNKYVYTVYDPSILFAKGAMGDLYRVSGKLKHSDDSIDASIPANSMLYRSYPSDASEEKQKNILIKEQRVSKKEKDSDIARMKSENELARKVGYINAKHITFEKEVGTEKKIKSYIVSDELGIEDLKDVLEKQLTAKQCDYLSTELGIEISDAVFSGKKEERAQLIEKIRSKNLDLNTILDRQLTKEQNARLSNINSGIDKLAQVLKWQLTINQRIRHLVFLFEALEDIHQANIAHRDIKPANIRVGEALKGYIIDFGLSRKIDKPDNRSLGTPRYAAPEMIAASHLASAAVDTYAMGLIAKELLGDINRLAALKQLTKDQHMDRKGKDYMYGIDYVVCFPSAIQAAMRKNKMDPVEVAKILKQLTHYQPYGRYSNQEALTAFRKWVQPDDEIEEVSKAQQAPQDEPVTLVLSENEEAVPGADKANSQEFKTILNRDFGLGNFIQGDKDAEGPPFEKQPESPSASQKITETKSNIESNTEEKKSKPNFFSCHWDRLFGAAAAGFSAGFGIGCLVGGVLAGCITAGTVGFGALPAMIVFAIFAGGCALVGGMGGLVKEVIQIVNEPVVIDGVQSEKKEPIVNEPVVADIEQSAKEGLLKASSVENNHREPDLTHVNKKEWQSCPGFSGSPFSFTPSKKISAQEKRKELSKQNSSPSLIRRL